MISYLYAALIAVGTLVIGILLGIWIRKRAAKRAEEKISNADEEALRIVNEAIKSAENKKREVMLEAKEDILRSRNEYEKEVKERRAEQQKQERRLQQKEETLDRKTDALEKREEALNQKHAALDKEYEEIKIIKRSQTEMLERISGFTAEDAKKYLQDDLTAEAVFYEGRVIGIELPTMLVREVVYTEPAVKGDTSGKVMKPARLATGFTLDVPAFVNTGDKIEIDTRTNEYRSRIK